MIDKVASEELTDILLKQIVSKFNIIDRYIEILEHRMIIVEKIAQAITDKDRELLNKKQISEITELVKKLKLQKEGFNTVVANHKSLSDNINLN